MCVLGSPGSSAACHLALVTLKSLWLGQERTLLTSTLKDTANAVVESSCIRRFESTFRVLVNWVLGFSISN